MSKPKTITSGYTNVISPEGEIVTLGPGDTVPEWATVTNPALFVDSDHVASTGSDAGDAGDGSTGSGEQTGGQGQTPPAADENPSGKSPGIAELRAEAKSLGLSAAGKKPELAARIAEKKAADANAAADADPSGEPDGDTDRAALEAKAKELGIEFDENNSDEELAALIEDETE